MGNDLNTSLGITALYDALKAPANDATKLAILDSYDQVLSLSLLEKAAAARTEAAAAAKTESSAGVIAGDAPAEAVALAEARTAARKAKDWAKADALRDELAALGWAVEDTAAGPKLVKKD